MQKLYAIKAFLKNGCTDCFSFARRKNPFKKSKQLIKHSKLPASDFDADFNDNDEFFEEWPANNMLKDIHGNDIEMKTF